MNRHDQGYQPGTDDGSRTNSTYAFASATTLLQALNERRISAVELLELYIQRIKRYNPALNAVVVFNEQEARQSAVRADEMRARGERAALLGLPLTIKESIDVAGLPATTAFGLCVPTATLAMLLSVNVIWACETEPLAVK